MCTLHIEFNEFNKLNENDKTQLNINQRLNNYH